MEWQSVIFVAAGGEARVGLGMMKLSYHTGFVLGWAEAHIEKRLHHAC